MPVNKKTLAFVLVAILSLPAAAQLISDVSQLNGDKGVKKFRDMYPALSGANLVYEKCGNELGIEDFQREYLKKKFSEVSKAYVIAYQDAYVVLTQAPPPASFVKDVASYLTKRQQDAVDNVAMAIRQKGCTDGRLRPIVKYVDSLRKQDLVIQKNATQPAPVAAPYQ